MKTKKIGQGRVKRNSVVPSPVPSLTPNTRKPLLSDQLSSSSNKYNDTNYQAFKIPQMGSSSTRSKLDQKKFNSHSAHSSISVLSDASTSDSIKVEAVFQSILRIRPLAPHENKKRKKEKTMLVPFSDPNTVSYEHYLNEYSGVHLFNTNNKRIKSNIETGINTESFHFDVVLPETTTQSQVYDSFSGSSMAWNAVTSLLLKCKEGPYATQYRHLAISNQKGPTKSPEITPPKHSHLLISMGVCNSGKTYTMFGKPNSSMDGSDYGPTRSKENFADKERGIVPRLLDDLFGAKENPYSKQMLLGLMNGDAAFGVEMSMIHIHNGCVYDLFSPFRQDYKVNKKSKKLHTSKLLKPIQELQIDQDVETQNFSTYSSIITCRNVTEARRWLYRGRSQTIPNSDARSHCSHGDIIITLRPVVTIKQDIDKRIVLSGGSITIVDMAGIECIKKSAGSQLSSRATNDSFSALIECLHAIKNKYGCDQTILEQRHQQKTSFQNINDSPANMHGGRRKKIPFSKDKLTMLLQPLFVGRDVNRSIENLIQNPSMIKTSVTIIMAAYPGCDDYNEKKMLLSEIDTLRGLSVPGSKQKQKYKLNIVDSTVVDSNSVCRNIDMHPSIIEEEPKEIHAEHFEDKISTPKPVSDMIICWNKNKCNVATKRNNSTSVTVASKKFFKGTITKKTEKVQDNEKYSEKNDSECIPVTDIRSNKKCKGKKDQKASVPEITKFKSMENEQAESGESDIYISTNPYLTEIVASTVASKKFFKGTIAKKTGKVQDNEKYSKKNDSKCIPVTDIRSNKKCKGKKDQKASVPEITKFKSMENEQVESGESGIYISTNPNLTEIAASLHKTSSIPITEEKREEMIQENVGVKTSPLKRVSNIILCSSKKKKAMKLETVERDRQKDKTLKQLESNNLNLKNRFNEFVEVTKQREHEIRLETMTKFQHEAEAEKQKQKMKYVQLREILRQQQNLLYSPLCEHINKINDDNHCNVAVDNRKSPFPLLIPQQKDCSSIGKSNAKYERNLETNYEEQS